MSKTELIHRSFPFQSIEIRQEGNGKILTGYSIIFDSLSEDLGGFREKIDRRALNKTLSDERNILALYGHDPAAVLGSTKSGTLQLVPDENGLRTVIYPPDTGIGRDTVTLVQRGDVTGMSFGFNVIRDTWDESGKVPIRTVDELRLYEVSIVSFPAYPATSVSLARSILNELGLNINDLSQALLKAKNGNLSREDTQHIAEATTRLESLLGPQTRLDSLLGAKDKSRLSKLVGL